MSDTQPNQSHELALVVLAKAVQEKTLADSHKERLALMGEKVRTELDEALKAKDMAPDKIAQYLTYLEYDVNTLFRECVDAKLYELPEGVEVTFDQVKAAVEAHPDILKMLADLHEAKHYPHLAEITNDSFIFQYSRIPLISPPISDGLILNLVVPREPKPHKI